VHFVKRIQDYMEKSSKEAKLRTSWISPNSAHDDGLAEFVHTALRADPANAFLTDFVRFREPIAMAGMLNSLSQTVVKTGSPGVPDFYQGSELWDDNLVDPDNRRPVDFAIRRTMLEQIIRDADRNRLALLEKLLASPCDGRIKMYVICRALQFRREHFELFARGAYLPLEISGERARHLIAFARCSGRTHALIVAGRFFMDLGISTNSFPTNKVWSNTTLTLSRELMSKRYFDVFTGRVVDPQLHEGESRLRLDEVFAQMPVAMLVSSDWGE
jgi:(1->4)-alpha-D-glucan 1-alpha-D-glucosylmutase